MASTLSSCLVFNSKPKQMVKFHRSKQVRAQAFGDEGRSMNFVDENMQALRQRIEIVRVKEGLDRCYRVEQYGWCYSPGYDHLLRKDPKSSVSLGLLVIMVCKTFGLAVVTSSLLLTILSLALHLIFGCMLSREILVL